MSSSPSEMLLVSKAIAIASDLHRNQFRNGSGLPYIVHPVQVMRIVHTLGIEDEEILAAAVLHDTVEDTDYTAENCRLDFPSRTASLVEELTMETDALHTAYLATFRSKSIPALVVKVVDRYCNVRDYQRDAPKYAPRYAAKACQLYEAFDERRPDVRTELGTQVAHRAQVLVDEVRGLFNGKQGSEPGD